MHPEKHKTGSNFLKRLFTLIGHYEKQPESK